MKRNNVVLNRRSVQRGRRIARWASTGMNVGGGREVVVAQAKALLSAPARLQQLSVAAQGDITQTTVLNAMNQIGA